MITLYKNISTKFLGGQFELPKTASFAPLVYGVLSFSAGLGIITTGISYFKKPTLPTQSVEKIIIPKKDDTDYYASILSRNIFNLDGTVPDSSNEKNLICSTTEQRKSPLAYKVTGIIYGGNGVSSVAMMESNNENSIYKVGDTLVDGLVISDITIDKVFIRGKGCPEYLQLIYPTFVNNRRSTDKKGKSNTTYSENGFERVGNTTTATKQWVNDILTNKLSTALEDARAVPYLVGGNVKGFTLTEVKADSVYDKLGLKNNDVVSSINGVELNDAARAIQTLNSLRNDNKIELSVIRGGQTVSLKVNIQ